METLCAKKTIPLHYATIQTNVRMAAIWSFCAYAKASTSEAAVWNVENFLHESRQHTTGETYGKALA